MIVPVAADLHGGPCAADMHPPSALCAVYWRGQMLCPMSTDRLWNAGHVCAKGLCHDRRCRCACGVERNSM
jgi:hypothetical protein